MFYFIYSFLFLIVGLILSTQQKFKKSYFIFYFLGIVLFWGISYIEAPDTNVYIDIFNYDIQKIPGYIDSQYELGYTLVAMVLKTICPHYWFFQLVVLGIEFILIIKGLQYFFEDKMILALVPLLFFIYPTNLFAFRQGIATSIFIYALQYINADTFKKSLFYFLFIAIAILFHQSAVMLIMVYPLRFVKNVFSFDWIIYTILIIGDIIWASGTSILSRLEFLMPLFRSEVMTMGDKYVNIYESGSMNGAFGVAKVFEINIAVILYTIFCKQDKEKELLRFIMIIFIISSLYIGGFVGHRLNYYWTIIYYVCFIRGMMAVSIFKDKQLISYIVLGIYMFWFYIFWCDYFHDDYKLLFNY